MRTISRKAMVAVAVIGIGLGGGAMLLTATDARTGDLREHVNSDWECVEGCSPDAQLCCDELE